MRGLIFIAIVLFSFTSLMAQSAEEEMIRLKREANSVVLEEPEVEQAEVEETKPGHWNFSVGTSYAYMKGYGSAMMFYTAPTYTLALNDRWALHGGVMASYYQGLNYRPMGESLLPATFSSLAVFVSASYRMSDRLVLHGTGTKQLLAAPGTTVMGYPMDDLSLGATLRIGDNMTIGASVHMRNGPGYNGYSGYNGYNGYHTTPFGSPFYPSPFGW
jgi:hypothetical protein